MSRVLKLSMLALILVLRATADPSVAQEPTNARPNIVLIISDDQHYRDFGFMGSTLAKTPNIDRLARGGTVFPNGYSTASTCRPALASLLTGLYPHQWNARVDGLLKTGKISDDQFAVVDFATLPRVLSQAGYATFQAGKLFEGTFEMSGFAEGMTDKLGSNEAKRHPGGKGLNLIRRTTEPVYDFLRSHRNDPFFLWFAPSLPHRPHDAPAKYRDLYRDDDLSAPELDYYSNVARLDEGVGSLIAYIDSLGLRSRTLIVFVVDNGWTTGTTPYGGRKGKGTLHDAGFRTPIVFNWSERVPEGAINESLVSIVDLYPTLLTYAGAPLPKPRPGINMLSAIEEGTTPVRELIAGKVTALTAMPTGMGAVPGWYLRTDRFHLIRRGVRRASELYDITKDPDELENLAMSEPTRVRKFERIVKQRIALDLEMLATGAAERGMEGS